MSLDRKQEKHFRISLNEKVKGHQRKKVSVTKTEEHDGWHKVGRVHHGAAHLLSAYMCVQSQSKPKTETCML